MILALVGLLMLMGPMMIFVIEGGRPDSGDGDLIHWFMSKTPEQMFLMRGSIIAGAALLTAALAQRIWMM